MEKQPIFIEEVTTFSSEIATAVRALASQLDSHFQPLTDQDIQLIISSDAIHLYLAYTQDTQEIAGMVTLVIYRIPYKMKGWIEDVVVDEAHRRKGIGEALMHHAISQAKTYKVQSLNLTSNPARESANQLYLRLGFEKRDTNVYRMMLSE